MTIKKLKSRANSVKDIERYYNSIMAQNTVVIQKNLLKNLNKINGVTKVLPFTDE